MTNIVILIIFILFPLLVIIFWLVSTLISIYGGIVFADSGRNILRKALKLANLTKGEVYYELGSGIGSGLLIASQEFRAKAVGVEISPFYWMISRFRTWKNKDTQVIMTNFMRIDLSGADAIYCYLSPKLMKQLSLKFKRELKKGSRVISYTFKLPGMKIVSLQKETAGEIYLYNF